MLTSVKLAYIKCNFKAFKLRSKDLINSMLFFICQDLGSEDDRKANRSVINVFGLSIHPFIVMINNFNLQYVNCVSGLFQLE